MIIIFVFASIKETKIKKKKEQQFSFERDSNPHDPQESTNV
jgi:hypothetical protein